MLWQAVAASRGQRVSTDPAAGSTRERMPIPMGVVAETGRHASPA